MSSGAARHKPRVLRPGSLVAPFSPASPASPERARAGARELERLGLRVAARPALEPQGYFAGPAEERRRELAALFEDTAVDGLIAVRGGYGSASLLDEPLSPQRVKAVVGFSDVST